MVHVWLVNVCPILLGGGGGGGIFKVIVVIIIIYIYIQCHVYITFKLA